MVEMTVSRRSYLLARPSHTLMRCAGAASAGPSLHDIANRQAEKQFSELMARVAAKPA